MSTLEVNEKEQASLASESVLWAGAFIKKGTLRKGITTS